jgi:hypothetical protein
MPYQLRELTADGEFNHALRFEPLQRIILLEQIKAVPGQYHATEKRERKLNMVVIAWVLIAMNVLTDCSLGQKVRFPFATEPDLRSSPCPNRLPRSDRTVFAWPPQKDDLLKGWRVCREGNIPRLQLLRLPVAMRLDWEVHLDAKER